MKIEYPNDEKTQQYYLKMANDAAMYLEKNIVQAVRKESHYELRIDPSRHEINHNKFT